MCRHGKKAYDQNLAGVVLSNHGGRQLDFARSGIEVLVEVVEKFKAKRGITFPNDRFQLFVDGGARCYCFRGDCGCASQVPCGSYWRLMRFSSGNRKAVLVCILDIWRRRGRSCPPDSDCPPLTLIISSRFEMHLRILGAQTIKDFVPDMVDAFNVHSPGCRPTRSII